MPRPRIAVFSGSNSTIQNTPPLVTSEKARRAYGLPSAAVAVDHGFRFDALRPQRLAAPVTVYIEQFSAHPLERDAAALYGPPDGYVTADGVFSEARTGENDVPVYRAVLYPDDGLYPLPYMARAASGAAWEATDSSETPAEQTRQTFMPDGSRLYEEIDRLGLDGSGQANELSRRAEFSFFRPMPSAGYMNAETPARAEKWGADFFPYSPHHLRAEPHGQWLARAANELQRVLSSGEYVGAQWLDASPSVDEVLYWLGLVVDTQMPLLAHASQYIGQTTGFEGGASIVQGVRYLVSDCWKDSEGRDKVGPLLAIDGVGFSVRDVTKVAARPGGFEISGGRSGMIADLFEPPCVTYIPTARHTWRSDLRMSVLPRQVVALPAAIEASGSAVVPVTDEAGMLMPSSIPRVALFTYVRYRVPGQIEVELSDWLDNALQSGGLVGLVYEGLTPAGTAARDVETVLMRAVHCGVPVVCAGRGLPAGRARGDGTLIGAHTLTGPKARILLMAALLKLGALPRARVTNRPTESERQATIGAVSAYQTLFDTH